MTGKDMDKRRIKDVGTNDVLEAHMSMLARRAFIMRQGGQSLFNIAEQLGLTEQTTKGLLRDHIKKAAQLVSDGARSDLLALEISRLDALQAAVWTNAMQGEARAIESALRVIVERSKLLGLDRTQVETMHQMVVIQNDDDDDGYLRSLKEIVMKEAPDGGS